MVKDVKRKKTVFLYVALAAVVLVLVLVWSDYRSFIHGLKGRYADSLTRARQQSEDAIPDHFKGVHRTFNTADKNIPAFVAEVTGYKAIIIWTTRSKTYFEKWCEDKFFEMVITADKVQSEYEKAASSFCRREKDIEQELINSLEKGMPYIPQAKFKTLNTKFGYELFEKNMFDNFSENIKTQLKIEGAKSVLGKAVLVWMRTPIVYIIIELLDLIIKKIIASDVSVKECQNKFMELQAKLNKASINAMKTISSERAKEREKVIDAFLAENVGFRDYLKYRFAGKNSIDVEK